MVDKDSLQGYSWQETLYYGVNNSKLVLALLSETYIDSVMCNEEFAVALSQHQSEKFRTHLLPIWTSKNKLDSIVTLKMLNSMKSMFSVLKILVPTFTHPHAEDLDQVLTNVSICQELLTLFINPILFKDMPRQLSSVMVWFFIFWKDLQILFSKYISNWMECILKNEVYILAGVGQPDYL